MSRVELLDIDSWQASFEAQRQLHATRLVEEGGLLLFPRLGFALLDGERGFLAAGAVDRDTKNISYDARTQTLRGTVLRGPQADALRGMLARYARQCLALVHALLPHYTPALEQARTSFRPVEAAGRNSSWRKDDRRLHVDAFPSSPNQGRRLLRVFSNIHPAGADRVWNIGEPFEAVAGRYLPSIARPLPGSAALLRALRITKSRRTEYDHIMLRIHDRMKADAGYQSAAPATPLRFAPGSTWIVCTDAVPHAALSGQFMMEQTFLLPVEAMLDPERSPLRILERKAGRPLA
jgi:hypothetical protein